MQEIADHVGCSQQYVAKVKADVLVTTSCNVSTRKDTKGRNQPTAKPSGISTRRRQSGGSGLASCGT